MNNTFSVVVVLAVLAGCGGKDGGPIDPLARPAFPADNALPEGDPRFEGQQRFLYETWGTEILGSWPPADFILGLMESEPEVFGNQLAAFGFIADPHDELPVGLKRGVADSTQVVETCAMCHVGRLPDGRMWLGAPNGELDIGRFRVELNKRWALAGNPSLMSDLEIEKASLLGPGRTNAETSDYPEAVPADFPPYFKLAERPHLNYLGTGLNVRTEVSFAIFALGAGDPNPEEALVQFPAEELIVPLIDFMGDIPAPVAPDTDPTLAARGREVFAEASCEECHHVEEPSLDQIVFLDREPDGLERLPGVDKDYERGSIRTSELHMALQDGGASGDEDRLRDYLTFIIDKGLEVARSDGYRASQLRGLWATAPYLHNGSVATLEDLLSPPAERATSFERGTFTVDTTVAGNSNRGHEFGTNLSADDRAALIEYLRTL